MTDDINDQLADAFDDDQAEFDFAGTVDDIPSVIEEKVVAVSSRQKSLEDSERATIDEGMSEKDLSKRAKHMLRHFALNFPVVAMLKDGSSIPKSDELNRTAFLDAVFDFGNPAYDHPVFDSFSQSIVMHDGRDFDKAWLFPIIKAMGAVGLEGQSYETVAESYKSWAIRHERNLLQDRIEAMTPEWDGVPRAEDYLIRLFRCRDTPTTRLVGKQFWLSLYNRATQPGCIAPVSIALVGGQNVGKSYFSQLISKAMIGSQNPPSVQLTFKVSERTDFLRNITGAAVVANVSEFYGFSSGDMDAIKAFTTQTTDSFGHKYMKERGVPRQWIVIMDGNDYKGFHRDDTGNRRFYPIFCNQLEDDAKGHPQWEKGQVIRADFEQGAGFDIEFWQVMSECKAWMAEQGMGGYVRFTNEVSDAVATFNSGEMAKGAGTISNEHTDTWLPRILMAAMWKVKRSKSRNEWFRASVALDHLQQIVKQASNQEFNPKALKRKMETMGFERIRELNKYHYVISALDFHQNLEDRKFEDESLLNGFSMQLKWWLMNETPKGAALASMVVATSDDMADVRSEIAEARQGIRFFEDVDSESPTGF